MGRNETTKVHQISFFNAGGIVADNAVLRLSIAYSVREIFAIKIWRCPKSRRILDVFGPPKFYGCKPPKSCA